MDEEYGADDDFADVATDTLYEQRIGRRYEIDRVPIGWRVDRPPKGLRKKNRRHEQGILLDLSMSGARVQAPSSPDLQLGRTVDIEIEGLIGTAKIRRIVETEDRKISVYGLEFVDSTADMARRVHYRLIGQFEVREDDEDDLADFYEGVDDRPKDDVSARIRAAVDQPSAARESRAAGTPVPVEPVERPVVAETVVTPAPPVAETVAPAAPVHTDVADDETAADSGQVDSEEADGAEIDGPDEWADNPVVIHRTDDAGDLAPFYEAFRQGYDS